METKNQITNPKKDFKDDFFVKPRNVRHFRKNNNRPSTSGGGSDFFLKSKEENKTLNQKTGENFVTEATSSSQTTDGTAPSNTKRPFDKKLYRLKKYSNKYKVKQWEEKRKKAVLHDYHRKIKHDQPTRDVMKIYEEDQDPNNEDVPDSTSENSEALKLSKNELFLKQKAEREQARMKAKKAKMIRYKKMSMKTRKGQPVMKYRVEKLFEQVQELVKDNQS